MLWVGVDIGGTFTDVIVYDARVRGLRAAKSLSTPAEPVRAVLDGLAKLEVDLGQVERFVHGTTRVTNALLEGARSPVAVLTTAGFRDVIEMGRGHRRNLYSVKERAAEPLVPRTLRFEVPERMRADGTVHRPLDEAALDAVLERIEREAVSGVAVCFLHAASNDAHEAAAARRVRERLPRLACSTSSEVVPEIGEYERFATTVLNVSVKPVVDEYLARFEGALAAHGFRGELSIMTSSGGVVSAVEARRVPMQLALSGPAGGVAASAYVAAAAGLPDVITCDMGGTSADVCLIRDGRPTMTNLAEIAGWPNKTFQVEIKTIGAGGGSIAWVDVGGELSIGPQSAGSTPGPACYGRGGAVPTTTDAHLVVGHLDADEPLGGEVRLDVDAARRAVATLAPALGGLPIERVALGVIQVAVARMTGAIKEITYARGLDPRDFALLPFGGAGPMHATALADELGIRRVIVPPVPGNLSALGFVTARARLDLVRMRLAPVDEAAIALVASTFAELEREARERLGQATRGRAGEIALQRSLGVRIRGQSFDVQVPLDAGLPETASDLAERFRAAYRDRYAYLPAATAIELVSCRLTAFGPAAQVDTSRPAGGPRADAPQASRTRRVYTADGWVDARVLARAELAAGTAIDGPAIIRESGATTVMGAGWRATVDAGANLILTRA